MVLRIKRLAGAVLLATCALAFSEPHENAGAASFDMLLIGAGARPLAMGGAYTAVPGDIYSLYWNPAGIASIKKTTFMADYMRYALDMEKGMPAFVIDGSKLGNAGTAGGYVNYFNAGSFEAVDENGNRLEDEDFTAAYIEGGVSFARQLPQMQGWDIAAGATFKGIAEYIADYRTTGLGFDFGVLCSPPVSALKLGATVKNLGTVFSSDTGSRMPMVFSAGLYFASKEWRNARFALDINKPLTSYYTIRLGGEYSLSRNFSVRAGRRFLENEVRHWIASLQGEEAGYVRENFNTWSFGVGIKPSARMLFDAAVLGNTFQSLPFFQFSVIFIAR
ncbi:MAG: hypothetical protein A2268_16910 [Candidatus Raymondbacteria bacterium RifOxyA12_full_50_37]|uniref:PorV/PorQ family protein n=1 Tax=Candidatus Raymondbacteria bacterium RIFOXYD12_FULL_49_13 TaxID=1817890 RepID=A0A1F7FD73_UNCRA|nr:MAG: hypothetical protein A2268_16910 [Candidatus Raymondbacteria bacterium RifOxyA12_full_50_37]OGJ86290.1 MAG: hypothetical protein A2248_16510 [Candidatus Raymondbacteria bacterium RIFOXYA2_FULL_49_16]OGJ95828.1 MAG: hypothetical protein A2453_11820 [Candidatus Raymondbacteria bacterium RIFOXYC2_FULL_50_21]OGJ99042.1 MAG: hypothetical protein A2350_17260 [Candidatus Raymondbacteria bacterium RifOxyB12_full_50_8]OGK04396.1 MAG: hypothetical protein A2519_18480 [Candidatus Raymondbacteria b